MLKLYVLAALAIGFALIAIATGQSPRKNFANALRNGGFSNPSLASLAGTASTLRATMAVVATLAQWDALLQEDYIKKELVSAIDNSTPFKDKLTRKGMTEGRRRVYAVKVGASQGQGARAEGGTMPQYGAGEYQNVYVTSKYNYAPFKVTGQSLEFSTRAAFVEFGMQILKDTKEGLNNFTGRQCWADGQGTLAQVNGAGFVAGNTVITVKNAYGVAWGSLATNTTFLFKRNMMLAFGAEDNGGQGYKVTAITTTTITVTPGLVNAIADSAKISILGSANQEIEGWLKLAGTSAFMTGELGLANGIYHNIDRSAFPEWEGNVVNAGAALSLVNIRTTRDTLFKRTNDEQTNLGIASTEVMRDFEALLVANQRFVPATQLKAGYSVLSHDDLGFTKDAKAPVKAMHFACTKEIAWAQTKDPHWLQDGNGIMRVVPGQDAFEALLKWYSNLDCSEPRRQAILYNLTVT